MKKFITILCLVLLYACVPVPMVHESQATSTLGSPDPMSKSCATNYVRVLGNYCGRTTAPSAVTLTSDNTCRSVDLVANFGIPSSTTTVYLAYSGIMTSAAAVAQRQVTTNIYTDNICTLSGGVPPLIMGIREWVATGATTVMSYGPLAGIPTRIGSNGILYYNSLLSTCTNCSMSLSVVGYFD